MRYKENTNKTASVISNLIDEVLQGEHIKERLPNASYDFSGELQARYFSSTRVHMRSDMGSRVMTRNQNIDELRILASIRGAN